MELNAQFIFKGTHVEVFLDHDGVAHSLSEEQIDEMVDSLVIAIGEELATQDN